MIGSPNAEYQVDNAQPVGPSAIAAGSETMCYSVVQNNMVEYGVPRALEVEEIRQIVQDFVKGAKNAMAAGKHHRIYQTTVYHKKLCQ